MSTYSIAEAIESGRTVMETGFPYAMLLTDVRCEKINELEKKFKEAEAKNTHLKFRLAHKHSEMVNVKQFYTGKAQQLQSNLTEATARLETKSKDVETIVLENENLRNKLAQQAGTIFQFNVQQRLDDWVSQQSAASKTVNDAAQEPPLLTAKSVWDSVHESSRQTAKAARQLTPPPSTQVATRKRGRPKKNLVPLIMPLPSASYGISGHSSVANGQPVIPKDPMWQNQNPGTSGSGCSGYHNSSNSNGNGAKKKWENVIYR